MLYHRVSHEQSDGSDASGHWISSSGHIGK